MPLPTARAEVWPDVQRTLRSLGARWAADSTRPRIAPAVAREWEALIDAWAADRSLPLLVRKSSGKRGAELHTASGRRVVPTDNSPAQWVFALAWDGSCPKLGDVAALLVGGRVPVAMTLTRKEKEAARYFGELRKCPNTQDMGWKLAHIQGVGLKERRSPEAFPEPQLAAHFRRLMSPSNMLVVPAAWSGLAEVPEFLAGYVQGEPSAPAS